jgi:hypothetical protein
MPGASERQPALKRHAWMSSNPVAKPARGESVASTRESGTLGETVTLG